MLILVNFPEYQRKIQIELDRVIGRDRKPNYTDRDNCIFLKAFGMEVLRFATVAPLLMPHFCRKRVNFEGYHIKPNSMVLGNVWFIHHDKDIWGDPWTFRPERFLDKDGNILPNDHKFMKNYLPFGYGQRQCAGALFAKTRYFLYVAILLQRWSFEFSSPTDKGCDPRDPGVFDNRLILKAKPFGVRAVPREKQ
ncbi:cytochrome P450 1A2-like [Ruditapes philippinarum]|uniref:cytochrome P450 1A2-like n=1 Tax=Ruditapes philippinarum TaxID=129788 RepID=UPI00295B7477|nr:cytochrome P450 1A2-like [Ruditapes philippinarum]